MQNGGTDLLRYLATGSAGLDLSCSRNWRRASKAGIVRTLSPLSRNRSSRLTLGKSKASAGAGADDDVVFPLIGSLSRCSLRSISELGLPLDEAVPPPSPPAGPAEDHGLRRNVAAMAPTRPLVAAGAGDELVSRRLVAVMDADEEARDSNGEGAAAAAGGADGGFGGGGGLVSRGSNSEMSKGVERALLEGAAFGLLGPSEKASHDSGISRSAGGREGGGEEGDGGDGDGGESSDGARGVGAGSGGGDAGRGGGGGDDGWAAPGPDGSVDSVGGGDGGDPDGGSVAAGMQGNAMGECWLPASQRPSRLTASRRALAGWGRPQAGSLAHAAGGWGLTECLGGRTRHRGSPVADEDETEGALWHGVQPAREDKLMMMMGLSPVASALLPRRRPPTAGGPPLPREKGQPGQPGHPAAARPRRPLALSPAPFL